MDPVLKKRLIGAVALIALAIIFLPMLIKGPAPDSGVSNVPMKVPNEPDGQFVEIPLAAPDAAPAGGAVGMPALVAAANPASVAPAAASNLALPATAAAGDYAVNFGAYATQADADTVAANLKQSGLPAYTAADTVGGKPAVRVRIGNYGDRSQAEIVRLQALKVRNDVKAQVVVLDATPGAPAPQAASVPLPAAAKQAPVVSQLPKVSQPASAKPVETPKPAPVAAQATKPSVSAPAAATKPSTAAVASGFAVQVGAFAAAADANALRDKARAAGLSAFVEAVPTDKGVLNRVRIGPVATRDAADALKAQVKAKLGIDGQVRPHP